jgi:hypothetical protein
VNSNYGEYPRRLVEFPVATGNTVFDDVEFLRDSTRFQSVYLASELTAVAFKAGDVFAVVYIKVS